jgi:hypothetical protein
MLQIRRLFVIFFFLWGYSSFGQLKKGNSIIGMNGFFQTGNNNDQYSSSKQDTRNTVYSIFIFPGSFVTDNIVLGLMAGYQGGKSRSVSNPTGNETFDEYTSQTWAGGIFGRYYIPLSDSRLAFFVNGQALYQSRQAKQHGWAYTPAFDIKSEESGKGFELRLQPGIVYFITQKIGVEAGFGNLSYSFSSIVETAYGRKISSRTSGGLNLNFSLPSFNLGVNFYLGKTTSAP